ncbi:MAG: hypothetical protein DRQ55_06575, partial [Planctomycetota bacterium]
LSWRSSALPDLDESTDSPAICRLDLHHERTTAHESTYATGCQGPWRERMAQTLAAKLVPVATTSAVMATVFGLFLLSSFPPVRVFGLLGALAMLAALVSTLVLLPALLLGPDESGEREASGSGR